MTQPDEYFPTSAPNYDSLAAFAAKTEEDWGSENEGLEVERWGGVKTGIRGGLATNVPVPVAVGRFIASQLGLTGVFDTLVAIGAALTGFAANVAQAVTDAGNALAQLASLILQAGANAIAQVGTLVSNAWTGVVDTWNGFWGAVFGVPASNKTASDFTTAAGSLNSTATTASTNANTANTNMQLTWNYVYDGLNDGSGSSGRTATDVRERARAVTRTARQTMLSGSNLVVDPVGDASIYWTQTNVVTRPTVRRR